MGLIPPFIDAAGLEAIKSYQYKIVDGSWTDRKLNHWWNHAVNLMPLWIPPNAITLTGFCCTFIAFLVVFCAAPVPLATPMVPTAYLAIAFLLFCHQTLDGIDGKQARRTGTSSPLGQIMDHGCDSFSTVFYGYCAAASIHLGTTPWTLGIISVMQGMLYHYSWRELHFHYFRYNTGIVGTIEGQCFVMAANTIVGLLLCFSIEVPLTSPIGQLINTSQYEYLITVIPSDILRNALLSIQPNWVIITFFIVTIGGALIFDAIDGIRQLDNKVFATVQLVVLELHLVFQGIFFLSGICDEFPFAAALIITGFSAVAVMRVQISSVCRMKYNPIQWPVLPFYAASTLLAFDKTFRRGLKAGFLLAFLGFWLSVYIYSFVTTSVSSVCDVLGIEAFPVIRIPKPQASKSGDLAENSFDSKKQE